MWDYDLGRSNDFIGKKTSPLDLKFAVVHQSSSLVRDCLNSLFVCSKTQEVKPNLTFRRHLSTKQHSSTESLKKMLKGVQHAV